MGRLGLIAGGGDLPVAVARRCEAEGRPVFVVRLSDFASATLGRYEGIDSSMGEFGRIIAALKTAGCDSVCFAGYVNRPDFRKFRTDAKGAAVLPGLIAAAVGGDGALLRKVLSVFEQSGFRIEGADEILSGETLPAGALGAVAPGPEDLADLRKALEAARATGRLEIGQGAVVCKGLVLAVEAQEGTDAMLDRVAGLPIALRGGDDGPCGALAKAPMPVQDRRVDLPVIGAGTVERVARAGLSGVAGEAGGLILIDREAIIAAADRLGLFVWGEPAP